MIKYLIIPTISIALMGCGNNFSTKHEQTNNNNSKQEIVVKTSRIQDTLYIKKWIAKVITDYINGDDLNIAYNNMRKELTDDYSNYKQDAIDLEYSEMTKEEFHQKWKYRYDTKYVGNGGYFTSVQDNGTVEVPICKHLKSLGDSAQIFHTVVRDLRWKTDYVLDITVITKDNKLLIDDVKEYK